MTVPKTPPKRQTIHRLTVDNVKRCKHAEVEVEGKSLVRIGGNNAQGKTSFSDGLMMALCGKKFFGDKPVSEGADKTKTRIVTDDFIILHSITPDKKEKLELFDRDDEGNADGKYTGARTTLKEKVSKYMIDPLKFLTLSDKEQVEELAKRAGLDLGIFDRKRKAIYDERTAANREKTRTEQHFASLDEPPEAQAGADMGALLAELAEANKHNSDGEDNAANCNTAIERLDSVTNDVATLERSLEIARTLAREASQECERMREIVSSFESIDTAAIETRIQSANEAAANAGNRAQWEAAKQDKENAYNDWLEHDRAIEQIDTDKRKAIKAAEMPVSDLSIGVNSSFESIVEYKGIPFSEASRAQKNCVSTLMVISDNPEFGIVRIEEGSLLDEEHLAMVVDLCADNGFQVWIETVGKSENDTITFVDGEAETEEMIKEEARVAGIEAHARATELENDEAEEC